MYQDLKGKISLITGSGKRSGIGYGIAKKLAENGSNIIISDLGNPSDDYQVKTGTINEMDEIAFELEKEFKVKTLAVPADVTNTESISKMVETVKSKFEAVDILCNNAGASFGVPNAIHTYDEDAWLKTIDVNMNSVYRVTKAVVPLMLPKGGTIINSASRAGKVPGLFNGAYNVSKAGVIMMTKVLAIELADLKIRVNAICPGQISTDLEKWRFGLEAEFFQTTIEEREEEMCKTIPLKKIGTIEEVANLVLFLSSNQSSYMTGQAVNVTGGQLMEL